MMRSPTRVAGLTGRVCTQVTAASGQPGGISAGVSCCASQVIVACTMSRAPGRLWARIARAALATRWRSGAGHLASRQPLQRSRHGSTRTSWSMGSLLENSPMALDVNRILRGPHSYNLKAHPISSNDCSLANRTQGGIYVSDAWQRILVTGGAGLIGSHIVDF